MPKLVESNMTNRPMGPKSLYKDYHSFTTCLISLPNLQSFHKGKTKTHTHIRGQESDLFTFYELFVYLNDLK